MFTHVTVGAANLESSRQFYDATFSALGRDVGSMQDRWIAYVFDNIVFAVGLPIDGKPASYANGVTIGLAAPTEDHVRAWYASGLANGGVCEGLPGLRNEGRSYVAYLRDPVGNKLCARHDFDRGPGEARRR
jgi:catechol 2,3-dioxygenase-like lactoylglutathione lyase family enzyme